MRGGDETNHSLCACEFEGGYIFLPRCEEFPLPLTADKLNVFMFYWKEQGWPNPDLWPNVVCHWAKLRLPNGQNARSMWHESSVVTGLRWVSCVEVHFFTE
jgi:hypothetical protein